MSKLSITRQIALEEVYKYQNHGFVNFYSIRNEISRTALRWLEKNNYIKVESMMKGSLVSCTEKGITYLKNDYS